MNECSPNNSWLCADSSTLDVLSSDEAIAFSQLGPNSYLYAEYDIDPLNKDSITMEILSLYEGGIRRECWANTSFQGVPIRTEYASLYETVSFSYSINRFYTNAPSCRITGYYKATYTGEVQVKVSIGSSVRAWIFDDSIQPNIVSNTLSTVTVSLIQGNYYYLRIDFNRNSSTNYFKIVIPGFPEANLSLKDLYYPVRTDYSPLDLNSLVCEVGYFLPVPETNGDMICPPSNLGCSTAIYTKNISNQQLNLYCENYRWEHDTMICEKCKTGSVLYSNICTLHEDYWEDQASYQLSSESKTALNIKIYKVISIQSTGASTRIYLIAISNPCISTQVWTCESTSESNLLSNSIFKILFYYTGDYYSDIATLSTTAKYSYHLNVLTQTKLNLYFWSEPAFSGSLLYNEAQTFSDSFGYLASYRSCRWEGFIKDLAYGDIGFTVSGTSTAILWIQNDSYPVITYICCTPATHNIRLAMQYYYYFRLDLSDTINTLNTSLKYRVLPTGSELAIPASSLYQPTRFSIGVITDNPNWSNAISNTAEHGMNYCPLRCSSCLFSIVSIVCTACIHNAYLINSTCECSETKFWNNGKCEDCYPLCKGCAFSSNILTCSSCVLNANLNNSICECNSGYYEDASSNSCETSVCPIELSLYKVSPYSYADTLFEVSNPCQVTNSIFCEETSSTKILENRRQVKFTDSESSLVLEYDISSESSYTFSVLHLISGSFLLESFPSSNWTGTPVSSISGVKITLSNTSGKSYRLLGYLKFPITAVYTLRFTSNTAVDLYIDYQSDPLTYSNQITTKSYKFLKDRYYNLRADFIGISSAVSFRIEYSIDTYNDIEPEKMFYADNTTISRWNIASCNSMIYTASYKNGLRYCPLLCNSCNLRVNRCEICSNEVCDGCVENTHLDLEKGKCDCDDGYYQISQ